MPMIRVQVNGPPAGVAEGPASACAGVVGCSGSVAGGAPESEWEVVDGGVVDRPESWSAEWWSAVHVGPGGGSVFVPVDPNYNRWVERPRRAGIRHGLAARGPAGLLRRYGVTHRLASEQGDAEECR